MAGGKFKRNMLNKNPFEYLASVPFQGLPPIFTLPSISFCLPLFESTVTLCTYCWIIIVFFSHLTPCTWLFHNWMMFSNLSEVAADLYTLNDLPYREHFEILIPKRIYSNDVSLALSITNTAVIIFWFHSSIIQLLVASLKARLRTVTALIILLLGALGQLFGRALVASFPKVTSSFGN